MIETLADVNDDIMAKYLEGEEISVEEIKAAIRQATLDQTLFPVLAGSAYKDKGIQMMLDAVLDYLPSPLDVKPFIATDEDGNEIELTAGDDKPFAALAFKIATDPFVGRLTFLRVYSGTLESGSYVLNATKGKRERVGRLLQMHSNQQKEIPEVFSGDIAAAIGLKNTTTGDSLTDPDQPLSLESMEFPEPVIQVSVEPKSKGDQDKMDKGLQKLAEEDPTFKAETNPETGETLIAGMGELHLDIIVDRLRREFNAEVTLVSHKFHTVKLLRRRYKLKVSLFVNLVVRVNTGMFGLNLRHLKKGLDSNSKMPLSVGLFLVNTFQPLNKGLRKRWKTVCLPATH